MIKSFRLSFRKEERLCSSRLAEELFQSKQTLHHFQYPLKAHWLFTGLPEQVPAQVVFPVSKKNFKRAHDRNRLRRLVRESYRLQKNFLYTELLSNHSTCVLAITYIAKEKLPYKDIFNATTSILHKIAESTKKHSDIHPAEPDEAV